MNLLKQEINEPTISFEFFPPKNPEGWAKLYSTMARTVELQVDFVSVTYGAGGSTRHNTLELVASIHNNLALRAMAHLTCIGHARSELAQLLDDLAEKGVEMIMALRGDAPQNMAGFEPHPEGFRYASELIDFIRQGWPHFKIGCAAYPEGHPESLARAPERGIHSDIEVLRLKQEAGASFAVTQLFFENHHYHEFAAAATAAGVSMPLIPGIMPLSSANQIERFVKLSGCSIPAELLHASQASDVVEAGFEFALEQCSQLLTGGVPGLHLYTLNQSALSERLLTALRVKGLLPARGTCWT